MDKVYIRHQKCDEAISHLDRDSQNMVSTTLYDFFKVHLSLYTVKIQKWEIVIF